MKKVRVLNLSVLAVASVLAACGSVKEAKAPRNVAGISDGLKVYKREDILFNDIQMYFWPENNDKVNTAYVLKQVEVLEELQDQVYMLRVNSKSIAKVLEEAGFDAKVVLEKDRYREDFEFEIQEAVAKIAAIHAEIDEIKKQVLEVRAIAPPPADLDQQVAALEKKITDKQKELVAPERIKKNKERALATVNKVLDEVKAVSGLWEKFEVYSHLNRRGTPQDKELPVGEIPLKEKLANEVIQRISRQVTLYDTTDKPRLSFAFGADGAVRAELKPWDLAVFQVVTKFSEESGKPDEKVIDPVVGMVGAATEYSTESRSIGKVSFDENGGIYTFEVYAEANNNGVVSKAVYWFKIAGTQYDALDGRSHFKGEIVRCSVKDGVGTPFITHPLGDTTDCGVAVSEADLRLPGDKPGTAVRRRGAINLVDKTE